jgi:acetyl-CoA carboxylase biotin carboxyl carrier protein
MLRKNKIKKVLEMLDTFDKYDFTRLSFKNKKFGILISEKNPKASRPVHSVAVERVASIESPIRIEGSSAPVEALSQPAASYHQVKAPMTGAFYRKPKPDAELFAKEGDIVDPDKTVCLLEAMKMFNEIKAGISGKIVKIYAEDGDFVAEGDVLFDIQPM